MRGEDARIRLALIRRVSRKLGLELKNAYMFSSPTTVKKIQGSDY